MVIKNPTTILYTGTATNWVLAKVWCEETFGPHGTPIGQNGNWFCIENTVGYFVVLKSAEDATLFRLRWL